MLTGCSVCLENGTVLRRESIDGWLGGFSQNGWKKGDGSVARCQGSANTLEDHSVVIKALVSSTRA